jgi:hypothetical protein
MLRLWILPVLVLIAVLGFACGDSGDDLSASPTTSSSHPSASLSTSAPIDTKTPAATASSPTASSGWNTYKDPDGRFTINFPSGWFLEDGGLSKVRPPGALTTTFSSFEPGTTSQFPTSALKVDLIVYSPTLGNDCRSAPEDSTPATVGGIAGWQTITPETNVGDGRSKLIAAYRDGDCYTVTGYFGRDNSDDATLDAIVSSVKFS